MGTDEASEGSKDSRSRMPSSLSIVPIQTERSDWVEMNVEAQLIGPCRVLDRHTSKTALEQWPLSLAASIEPAAIRQPQPLHTLAEIRVGRLDDGVVVVAKQAIRMDHKMTLIAALLFITV